MTKRQEKGKVGSVSQYITRAKVLKKLQLSLADFRRLCIIKGVYPRVPSTKKEGSDKTYYHVRDIRFLSEDNLRQHIYDSEASKKKQKKHIGRGQISAARRVESGAPKWDLSHVVRERYPTFAAALMDLDDCLSTLALIASLQSHTESVSAEMVQEAKSLYWHFVAYVASTSRLSKVFASIKGFYLQAALPTGATATWLHPHKFTQAEATEVDMKVIGTFAEWYTTFLKFINFKLFADEGRSYPPKGPVATEHDIAVVADYRTGNLSGIFSNVTAFVSREVPFLPVYITLVCGGAEVRWAGDSLGSSACDASITHVIVDKPASSIQILKDREFIQPQWVLDSFNEKGQLSCKEYAPGAALPPHLSPFASADAEYVPQRRQYLDELRNRKAVKEASLNSSIDLNAEEEAALKTIDDEVGIDRKIARKVEVARQQEERQKSVMLLSKKHKRLLDKIESAKKTKRDTASRLKEKAEMLSSSSQ